MGCPTGAAAGTSTSYPSVLEQVTVTGNFEPPPGPEDSRATPLGGMDHSTVVLVARCSKTK